MHNTRMRCPVILHEDGNRGDSTPGGVNVADGPHLPRAKPPLVCVLAKHHYAQRINFAND